MFEGICDILGLHAFVLVYIQHIHALTYIYIHVYIYYMQCTFTFIHIYYTLIIIQAHTPTPILKILFTCNYASTLHIQHAPSCINKCAHLYNIWFQFVFFNNYYYLLTYTAHILTYPHLYYLVSAFMFIFYHLFAPNAYYHTHIFITYSLHMYLFYIFLFTPDASYRSHICITSSFTSVFIAIYLYLHLYYLYNSYTC